MAADEATTAKSVKESLALDNEKQKEFEEKVKKIKNKASRRRVRAECFVDID